MIFNKIIKRNLSSYLIKDNLFSLHKESINRQFDLHKESTYRMLNNAVSLFTLSITGLSACMYIMKQDIDKKFDELKQDNNKKFDELKQLILEKK
jgi:hypothetical protein